MIGDKIIAAYGKVFRRISDGQIFGCEIFLGYAYRLGDKVLSEPYLEKVEDFEEIDDPNDDEIVFLDEETVLFEDSFNSTTLMEEQLDVPIEDPIKHVVTLSDYRELERKVELLMKLIGEK